MKEVYLSLTPANPTVSYEHQMITTDGAECWQQWIERAFFDEQGEIVEFRAIRVDISERKRLEAERERAEAERQQMREILHQNELRKETELRLALEKEKELGELKNRFVSMISHEFRTPLTIIQAATELLESYECDPIERAERFRQIYTMIDYLVNLLEDVLFIGKAESGEFQCYPSSLDLTQFCQELIADFRLTYGQYYLFNLTILGTPQPVYLDPKLLRQILGNLFSNAVKYSPEGGQIWLELDYSNTHVVDLRVRDEGMGIPTADQQHIFRPFHRATNEGTIQGTGLGLCITERCVALMGGMIVLESEVGQGSRFTITLPRTVAQSVVEQGIAAS